MLKTSERLLRLLTLLQSRPDWTGPQLAEELEVSTRTIRTDVERLRELGYPVHATSGVAGGYRLGAGRSLPPLLLDDDEAVAVAAGLSAAAGGRVTGAEEASLRALTKLEEVLPSRLRHRIRDLLDGMVTVTRPETILPAHRLVAIAAAIRSSERVRFDYAAPGREPQRREAEPHRLVHTRERWYLVAWDVERGDWRTFRIDRMELRTPNGRRFAPRPLPAEDLGEWIEGTFGAVDWRHRARVLVRAPAESLRSRLPAGIALEPIDDASCWADVGSDDPAGTAMWLSLLGADFEVVDDPALADELRRLADRLMRAAG